MFGSNAQQVEDGRVKLAFFREAFPDLFQLIALGQAAEPEQEAGFFEIGVVGEVVNIDAAIRQNALFAVDVTDAGGGGNERPQGPWARASWLRWTYSLASAADDFCCRPTGDWHESPQRLVIRQNAGLVPSASRYLWVGSGGVY